MTGKGVIVDWTRAKAAAFGRETLSFRHRLHERPLFEDASLASILDRYPRERLGIYTMGEDLTDWTTWRRGEADHLSGADLLAAVKAGRLWLNLRDANRHLPEFEALCGEIADDKQSHVRGLKVFNRDLGLLISSPRAMVFYHLDVPLSSLWQVRGEKRIWFYPRREPFVAEAQIERFVRRQAEGQFAFRPEWDDDAQAYDLTPGDMITWAQNVPHRVVNGAMLNVSVSMEFMTPAAALRANILYANGLLRQRWGLSPSVQEGLGPTALAKVVLARAAKATAPRPRAYTAILPAQFRLARGEPGVLHTV